VAFALVHFTVGFVTVLAVLSVVSVTRYRLTGAYLGGVWALLPDARHLADGALGKWLETFHDSPRADVFFFHHTLDTEYFRSHEIELTFVSLLTLGVTLLVYDWWFGVGRSVTRKAPAATNSDESP